MTEGPRKLASKTIPIEQAIYWKPLDDSYHLLAATLQDWENNYLAFLPQRLVSGLSERARADGGVEQFGLVMGRLFRCPNTGVRFTLAESAQPIGRAPDDLDRESPAGLLWLRQAVADAAASSPLEMLGWYAARPEIGTRLSESDEVLHAQCFREPWHTALVSGPAGEFGSGALYRLSGKGERSFQSPFYELIEGDLRKTQANKRTLIDWINYVTDEPLLLRGPTPREQGIIESGGGGFRPSVKRMLEQIGLWKS
jgi:hypothetical protein